MAEIFPMSPGIYVRHDSAFGGERSYVQVLPRRVDHPTQYFRTEDEARAAASIKRRQTGWPIFDQIDLEAR